MVWYSQRLTEWLGTERFQRYVTEFKYGNQDISGDKGKDNGLTNSWLSSSLKISPQEQTVFLRQIIHRQLKVSPRAYDMTDEILKVGTLPNGWEIRGKTGSGNALKADGTRDPDRQFGWFVGWAKKADKTVIFVRNIQDDKKQDSFASIRARESMMADLPAILSNQ